MSNFVVIITLLVSVFVKPGHFTYWWALGTQSIISRPNDFSGNTICRSLGTLNSKQKVICRRYPDLLVGVAVGAKHAIDECKYQFKTRRWNCPVVNEQNTVFGPILKRATRESAFIHGITAAGVAYSVTETCAQGQSLHCSCDSSYKPPSSNNWKWGGCSRDVRFGLGFSEKFVDSADTGKRGPRKDMNAHNNRAGREAIISQLWRKCKCHGLSGSCDVQTCWIQQPKFRQIGEILRRKYDSAHEMKLIYRPKHGQRKKYKKLKPKHKEYKRPTPQDLIYYEPSPNFCHVNRTIGSFGTRGRECNITSAGVDGCELMCCRRGYDFKTVSEVKSCNCKFVWCCRVQCAKCTRIRTVYTCR